MKNYAVAIVKIDCQKHKVINVATMKVEKKIAVGKFTFWIAVQGNP